MGELGNVTASAGHFVFKEDGDVRSLAPAFPLILRRPGNL